MGTAPEKGQMNDYLDSGFPTSGHAVYRIRVRGRLDSHWSERFQGMEMSTIQEKGFGSVTVFSGPLPDQAALMGVLELLYTCGAVVLSVECITHGECDA
jgi:hypothetical protein